MKFNFRKQRQDSIPKQETVHEEHAPDVEANADLAKTASGRHHAHGHNTHDPLSVIGHERIEVTQEDVSWHPEGQPLTLERPSATEDRLAHSHNFVLGLLPSDSRQVGAWSRQCLGLERGHTSQGRPVLDRVHHERYRPVGSAAAFRIPACSCSCAPSHDGCGLLLGSW